MLGKPLPADKLSVALARIAAWREQPFEPVLCPVCEAEGLHIADQSARPYAEWYVLTCPACSLNATIHVPLGPPVPGSDSA